MTYAQYGKIEASDYNTTLVSTNPSAVANRLNTVWAIGNNNAGYGQTGVGSVSVGNKVNHLEWDTLIGTTSNVATHQGSSITSVTQPAAGDKITYNSAIATNLVTIYSNRLNASVQGTSTSNTVTYGSTWNNSLLFTHTATFANGDAARYFFNSGGQFYIQCIHPTSGAAIDILLNGLASNVGNIYLSSPTSGSITIVSTSFNGITKIGGGGNSPTISTNTGYYALTTSNAVVFTQTATASSTYIEMTMKSNGTQGSYNDAGNELTFYTLWQQVPAFNDAQIGTQTNLYALYPETTNIANTWGTVSLTGSVTASSLTTTTTTTTAAPTTTTTTTTAAPTTTTTTTTAAPTTTTTTTTAGPTTTTTTTAAPTTTTTTTSSGFLGYVGGTAPYDYENSTGNDPPTASTAIELTFTNYGAITINDNTGYPPEVYNLPTQWFTPTFGIGASYDIKITSMTGSCTGGTRSYYNIFGEGDTGTSPGSYTLPDWQILSSNLSIIVGIGSSPTASASTALVMQIAIAPSGDHSSLITAQFTLVIGAI
jgi:hypothetical protein